MLNQGEPMRVRQIQGGFKDYGFNKIFQGTFVELWGVKVRQCSFCLKLSLKSKGSYMQQLIYESSFIVNNPKATKRDKGKTHFCQSKSQKINTNPLLPCINTNRLIHSKTHCLQPNQLHCRCNKDNIKERKDGMNYIKVQLSIHIQPCIKVVFI